MSDGGNRRSGGVMPQAPPCAAPRGAPSGTVLGPLKAALEPHERRLILAALDAFGWDRGATARALDVHRSTLYRRMEAFGLLEVERRYEEGRLPPALARRRGRPARVRGVAEPAIGRHRGVPLA